MELFADRFALDDHRAALDLATGSRIALRRIDGIGDSAEQIQWALRCDRWAQLHHHAVAPLIDYGPVGRSTRFEAWECGGPWEGSDEAAAHAGGLVARFLDAANLTRSGAPAAHVRHGRTVVIPGAGDGYERDAGAAPCDCRALAVRGLTTISRPAVASLAELFDSLTERRPRIASLWGIPGSGRRTVVRQLARAARLKGLIPVASRLLASAFAPLWRGRTLLVVHDARDDRSAGPWPRLLHAVLRTPLPHVLLIVAEDESATVDGIRLAPVATDELLRAVHPPSASPRLEERVRRAAAAARGLPGRFARLLWPEWPRNRGPVRCPGLRAAEGASTYGFDEPEGEPIIISVAVPSIDAWPAPGELAALRKRVESAAAQLSAGRHTPAIRQLRQVTSALARRDAWSDAVAAALRVANALTTRGRAKAAIETLDEAREYAERAGDELALIDIAIAGGEARIDLVRFDEAEAILSAVAGTPSQRRDVSRLARASTALARCLFWRGQYADAAASLAALPGDLPAAHRVHAACLQSRIDVGHADIASAMSRIAALKGGEHADDPALRTSIECTSAFVRMAAGDLEAALQNARDASAAARAEHNPLGSIRARLLLVEIERRRGSVSSVMREVERLRRVCGSLPPLLRARCELITLLAAASHSGNDAGGSAQLARRIADTGVPALALYVPEEPRTAVADPAINDVLVILRACQTAEDEALVLKDVCAHVRRQLRAAGAAFVGRAAGGRCEAVAADGARVEPDVAVRAMSASITVRPHRSGDRFEGAAPVVYGGAPIGALSARWSIGSPCDADRASSTLAMAATAAAPMLAAALAHRARMLAPAGTAAAPLIGVTPAIVALRDAALRAGTAPFGVLVTGESGSGKELVARAVHRSSARRDGPFCPVNCAALPDDLVESELFGHARGAFTGAIADRPGVFEEAHGGTLFFDEIGELSPRAQAKILRVIQEGELRRVGENTPRRVDVRLVAATNRNLAEEVDAGRFRLDLLYRLDVIRIAVPPLRDRAEDIVVLAAHFWNDATLRIGSRATLAPSTMAALTRYHWPGNVRELQNVLASLAVRSPRRGLVPPSALPPQFGQPGRDDTLRLEAARRTFEERFVRAALVRTGGHRMRAAVELGVSRQGLTKLLARLGISDVPAAG